MQIDSIFEKRERALYHLLLYLEDRKDAPSIKEACLYLELSKSTLLRYIETFNEEGAEEGLGLHFKLSHELVYLQREAGLTRQDILAHFCQTSIKYQILLHLLAKEDLSLQQLAQELLISEATLNRQLASLNHILAEFGLAIKTGRIKGSELQIRYFYHQLLSWTKSADSLEKEFKQFEPILPVFERFYHSTFHARQRQQVLLWLMISQRRSKFEHLDFKDLYQLMRPYQEHKFYRRMRKLYFTLYQQQSGSFQEGEIMAFFAFLFSHFILEPHQLEQVLGFGGPIMEATSLALQDFRTYFNETLPVSEEALYHLNQIMGQAYFFYSSIQVDLPVEGEFDREAEQLIKRVYQLAFARKSSSKLVIEANLPKVVALYIYFSQVRPIQVKVAFAHSGNEVLAYPLLQELREKLERNRQVFIDPYRSDRDYDLIITDYLEGSTCPLYYLGTRLKHHDVSQLKELIQEIYQQKSFTAEKLVSQANFQIEHR